MILFIAYALALTSAAAALWVRRHTWRMTWEKPTTLTIALLAAGLVLIVPCEDAFYGRALHALTGLWHVDDLIGFCCFVVALSVGCAGSLGRIARNDREEEWLARHFVTVPSGLGIPLMVAAFTWSGTLSGNPAEELWGVKHDVWGCTFWVLYLGLLLWLMAFHVWTLWPLRHDPRSKAIAMLWLSAVMLGIAAMCVWMLPWTGMKVFMDYARPAACAATVVYSLTAARQWRNRLRPYRKLLTGVGGRL